MADSVDAQTSDILADTKAMIDGLKTVCADAGLANDSSEYKIITESFLYKFLNDKFLYELRRLPKFKDAENIETAYTAMSDEERELACTQLPEDTAFIDADYLIPTLFNKQNEDGFHETLDAALKGISADNVDIFSVKTGEGQAITLFGGVSQYVLDAGKKDPFCKALVNKLANFSFERAFSQKYDFFSVVFEYLISDYNKDSGTYGEYFTPHSIASIIARILVPDGAKDVSVYDPAAGSGTLVLAIAHEIGEDNCTIYTQDRSQKANEFMRLNLILNNLVHSLPNVVHDDTLLSPRHLEANGKSLKKFDYIVSNPPFNCDFSSSRDTLAGDNYRTRFWLGVPNIPSKDRSSMAIYLMFLQHIVFSLGSNGKAAIVVPTGFLSMSKGIGKKFRDYLVENNMLDGVIKMPPMIFANTGTRVSVIFLDKNKGDRPSILIDASGFGEKVSVDGDTQRVYLSKADVEKIIGLYRNRIDEKNLSVLVRADAFNEDNSFAPAHYFPPEIAFYDYDKNTYLASLHSAKRQIKEILSEEHGIDDLLVITRRLEECYEKFAEMVFDHWFVRFEFPGEQPKLSYSRLLDSSVPEGWRVENIQNVCDVIDCLHSKKPDYCFESEDKYLLTLENVTTDGFIDLKKRFYVSSADYDFWTQRTEVESGDFVVTNAGRAGCIARIPAGVKCGIARNLTAIKPRKISSLYLRQFLKSYWFKRQVATSLDEGSFFLSYNVKSIKRINVLIPPEDIVERYENVVANVLSKTAFCCTQVDTSWLLEDFSD